MNKPNNIKVEILLNKLAALNKTNIVLPIRESSGSTQAFVSEVEKLVTMGLISEEYAEKIINERWSRTLDDETFDLFYECLSL